MPSTMPKHLPRNDGNHSQAHKLNNTSIGKWDRMHEGRAEGANNIIHS